ncbi:MAG: serine/threonine-protein kinase [Planctomycetota bacterium]
MVDDPPPSDEAERFARAEALFVRAMERPEAEREAFVHDACGDDDLLATEVARLLGATGDADPFGGVMPTAPTPPPVTRTANAYDPGESVGPYTIEKILGRGGFGEVYLAQQSEPIERRVAVKVVRSGLDGDDVLERFERERRTLALMEHPGIARVFDAGIASGGRPYVVMEYIDGLPIDEYCDGLSMPIERRVELIAGIARALHHAHQRGVIHRDIKPSNVLVTEIDGEPTPKLIDFGIAKATEDTGVAMHTVTAAGATVGTPQYMSPEQASGLELDTRSDVYSMAALAFRLLAGDSPIPASELRAVSVHEALRRLSSLEPPRASDRAGQLKPEQAMRIGLEPPKLRTRLRGDLDWILAKAMAREPERRYEAASDFARDLERHLANEPVEAGPPSLTYRVTRFAARNRAVVIAGTLTATALVLGLAGTTAGFVQAEAALDIAQEERDLARAALEETERQQRLTSEINRFFSADVFSAADPFEDPDPDRSVIDALERALAKLDGRFDDEPLIEAEIRNSAGGILDSLGRTEEAHDQIREAIKLFASHGSEDPVRIALSRVKLGSILGKQGRYEEAASMIRAAVDVLESEVGADSENFYRGTNELVYTLIDLGQLDEAETTNGVLLDAADAGALTDQTLVYTAYANAGSIAYKRKNAIDAEPWFRRSYELCLETHGPSHPSTINMLSSLAVVVQRNGDPEASLKMHADAVAGATAALGRDHPYTQTIRNNQGLALSALGRYEDAQEVFSELLLLRTESFGEDHPDTLVSMILVANNLARLERFEEAEEIGLRGHRLFMQTVGPDHFGTQRARDALVSIYTRWNRPEDAARWRPPEDAPSSSRP